MFEWLGGDKNGIRTLSFSTGRQNVNASAKNANACVILPVNRCVKIPIPALKFSVGPKKNKESEETTANDKNAKNVPHSHISRSRAVERMRPHGMESAATPLTIVHTSFFHWFPQRLEEKQAARRRKPSEPNRYAFVQTIVLLIFSAFDT